MNIIEGILHHILIASSEISGLNLNVFVLFRSFIKRRGCHKQLVGPWYHHGPTTWYHRHRDRKSVIF